MQRAEGLAHAVLAHLRPLVLTLELLKLLLQLREVGLREPRLRVQLVELLVKAHPLHDELLVDVLLPLEPLLDVLAGLVGDFGTLVHELETHVLLPTLRLRVALQGRVPLDRALRALDLADLLALLVSQGAHRVVELLGLLAYPLGVGLDLVVLHLVGVVQPPIPLRLLFYLAAFGVVLFQLLLVAVLLLSHLLNLLLQQLYLFFGTLDFGLGLCLPLIFALLQLSLLISLLVLKLLKLDLQHLVLILNDFVLVLNLHNLIIELLYGLLVLLRLEVRLFKP
mmetsp:Transcript_2201/g.7382  ORF Transcript_2201/g.7382 Transcript_2201/m.7382 type:complete len:281 (+) Transcript_2201:1956-2798(+)